MDMVVVTRPMATGSRFKWHIHSDHQIAWASSGVLTVATEQATWVLPPTRALWIPAGLAHETRSPTTAATVRSVFVRPETCPIAWPETTPIAARVLLAELIGYLASESLDRERRSRAEALLIDLLEPVTMSTLELRMPTSDPARKVAAALVDGPADQRTLDDWGREVGVSGRTLARSFLAETGVPFGRWRTLARMHAALQALADGVPVGNVARRIGYESVSAFVAAFRRETGMTPASYFNDRGAGSRP